VRRSLFNLLTLLSLLLAATTVTVWLWSDTRNDFLMLKTAPSYARWPGLKWVQIHAGSSWTFDLHDKAVPSVYAGRPPSRMKDEGWKGEMLPLRPSSFCLHP
jgi:hypothetical protein